jgi:hypothetical protein
MEPITIMQTGITIVTPIIMEQPTEKRKSESSKLMV